MKTFFSINQKIGFLVFSIIISVYLISYETHPFLSCKNKVKVEKKDSVAQWNIPELSSIPSDEKGDLIRLGRYIFIHTYNYIGPDVKDPAKRFTGTNMDCQNCHFKGGTVKYVLGLIGVYNDYPEYDARSAKVISLQQRINSCLMRSMNGKPMPENSEEMTALVEYIKWLSSLVPKGTKTVEQGLPKIPLINRAADPSAGKQIFNRYCTTCHAENGEGVLNKSSNVDVAADSSQGYNFPPVMGSMSYNDGAGIYRLLMAASFIYSKMPYNAADLSIEDSYDVAAYINTMPRSKFADIKNDYPDLQQKPIDFPFSPYEDGFTEVQHKYGPYQGMFEMGEKSDMIRPE